MPEKNQSYKGEKLSGPAKEHITRLKGNKILVVDDEPDVLTYLTAVLEDDGATVVQAIDGVQALDLARKEKPDLITLDLSMPGLDGGQVFEALRKDPELCTVPVCIITGKPELRRLIYDRSVPPPEGYLDKPVNQQALLLNVRKILELAHRKKISIQDTSQAQGK